MSFTPHIVLICALQFADFLRLCLSPQTTSRTISFSISIVFGINLIPFFEFCSVLALLSPPLFGYLLLYLGCCVIATVAVCGFGMLVFGVSLRAATSNLPSSINSTATPSQTEMFSTIGESIRRSSFHNPTLSANKHVMQIYRSSLSASVQTVHVSVEPRLSTTLKDRSVVPLSYHHQECPILLGKFSRMRNYQISKTATGGRGADSVLADHHRHVRSRARSQQPALLQTAAEIINCQRRLEKLKADCRVRHYKEVGLQQWPLAG